MIEKGTIRSYETRKLDVTGRDIRSGMQLERVMNYILNGLFEQDETN